MVKGDVFDHDYYVPQVWFSQIGYEDFLSLNIFVFVICEMLKQIVRFLNH